MIPNTLNIDELLARGRAYYKLLDDRYDSETNVSYNSTSQKFQVESVSYWKADDGEGHWYWESGTAGLDFYSPREFNIHLDSVEEKDMK